MTSSAKRSSLRRVVIVVVTFVVAAIVVLAVLFGAHSVNGSLAEQGAQSVRESIIDAANQCAAIEGSYPASLQYLEDNYGLRVNHDDYAVTYEVFATNVAPSVVVAPR